MKHEFESVLSTIASRMNIYPLDLLQEMMKIRLRETNRQPTDDVIDTICESTEGVRSTALDSLIDELTDVNNEVA